MAVTIGFQAKEAGAIICCDLLSGLLCVLEPQDVFKGLQTVAVGRDWNRCYAKDSHLEHHEAQEAGHKRSQLIQYHMHMSAIMKPGVMQWT